jgi:hypothetical protein
MTVSGTTDSLKIKKAESHEYEIESLDSYSCHPTKDYIVCSGFNGDSFPVQYVNSVKTYLHLIRRIDGELEADNKTLTTVELTDNSFPSILPKN